MTRRDQIEAVATIAGITRAQARTALDVVGGLVKTGLIEDEKVMISGLGTFVVAWRPKRKFRDNHTKQITELPARPVIKFRPVTDLRASVEEAHAR